VAGRQSSVSCFYNFHAFTRTIHMPPPFGLVHKRICGDGSA
jgi:hypothetical protein